MIAVAVALLMQAASQTPGTPASRQPAQMGVTIVPETVTVGDPFRVIIRVRGPRGTEVRFPAGPDSASGLELLDPRAVGPNRDSSAVDQTATYRVAAWDVGDRPLQMGDVVVRTADGERTVSLGSYRIFVRSVLPADSALRVPKPPRPVFEAVPPWWRIWLIIGLALVLLALLLWLLWRWWRRRQLAARAGVDPYEYAEREFKRVEALGLLEAGERGRFVALMVEVLRDYLARRLPGALPSLTSTELLAAVRGDGTVPADRLSAVLAETDLIKFARRAVTPERARELAREARGIVRDVNQAQATAAAAAATASRERAA
jgi:hypothetical protein